MLFLNYFIFGAIGPAICLNFYTKVLLILGSKLFHVDTSCLKGYKNYLEYWLQCRVALNEEPKIGIKFPVKKMWHLEFMLNQNYLARTVHLPLKQETIKI